MSTLLNIDSNVSLHGLVTAESLTTLTKTFKNVLYLCPDDGDDCGIEGGFSAIASAFPKDMALQVSISSNENVFQPEFYQTNFSLAIHAAVTKFAAVERALDALLPNGPTLITCKSNRRAGLMWATYTGKRTNLTSSSPCFKSCIISISISIGGHISSFTIHSQESKKEKLPKKYWLSPRKRVFRMSGPQDSSHGLPRC